MLASWKKIYDKPSIKNRDITLPTKVHLVKAMFFPVVMHGCNSWTIKKAECQRIDAFELWCWVRLLRVPWTARRSNQWILREISPEYSLEGVMLKLKLFGHQTVWPPDAENWLLGKDPDDGKDLRLEANRATEDEIVGWHHWLNGYEFDQAWELVIDREAWGAAVHVSQRSDKTEQLNWTDTVN